MLKRMLSLVLVVLLVAAVLPVGVSAADDAQQLRKTISRDYYRALSGSGMESLHGYCGLMTSWQLYLRGVTNNLMVYNGKDQYNAYCDLEYTSGGHAVKAYPASEYSLEEALNAATHNGTRDVYNILVGFQSTSTEAGSIYGHAMMIYAILDGVVYCNESFPTPMCYTPGGVIECSIERFADYYDDWTRFEGIVVFGNKEYTDSCQEYASHMFVETTQQTYLYTEPCDPENGEVKSEEIRSVAAGERLLVTALFENTLGQYYYQVDDGGTVGYVSAAETEPLRFNYEDLTVTGVQAPEALEQGQGFNLEGEVGSLYSGIGAVHVAIIDQEGQTVLSHSLSKASGLYDLKGDTFDKMISFGNLEEGCYTFSLTADGENHYILDDQIYIDTTVVSLQSSMFRVGDVPETAESVVMTRAVELKDGWVYEQGSWYYYEMGTPRTGWLCYNGLDYYLRQDGSVTTGWAEINGKLRLFTSTGAMRTGWIDTEEGKQYLLTNGVAAQGWRKIDGALYCFGDDGILCKDTWVDEGADRYYLLSDGSAATGWVELEEGSLCFDEDGKLIAKSTEENGTTVIQAYDPQTGSFVQTNAVRARSLYMNTDME